MVYYFNYPPQSEHLTVTQDELKRDMKEKMKGVHFYVAKENGAIIGCGGIGAYSGSLAESRIHTIFVEPAFERQSIGRRIRQIVNSTATKCTKWRTKVKTETGTQIDECDLAVDVLLREREGLEEFGKKWDGKYPTIRGSWKRSWDDLAEFFGYLGETRRATYTTNAIELLNLSMRKVTRNKSSFPDDESIHKVMYLAIKNASARWTMPIKDWGLAVNQFAILFEGRVPL